MKKKQIVFKVPEFPQVSETFIVAQIITAIKLGYEVQIIIRKLAATDAGLCSGLIEEYGLLDKIILEDYKIPTNKFYRVLKWSRLLMTNINQVHYILKYYRERSKFSLSWLFEWVFYKQFNNVNIVHVQYGTYKYPMDLLKKTGFFKPAIIVTFHGHDAFFPLYGYIENNGYYKNLFDNNILITANTNYLANLIVELGCSKDKMVVIPVGVNTSFFYPNPKVNEFKENYELIKLITVGRLDKIKGHKYCIEVIKKLLEKGINATLTIVGEGEERANLENLIQEYKLERNVFLLGSKGPTEVRDELWKHHIYLLLAVPVEDNRRETQGLATLEAQACGLPAIVFDSGGVKYTVKDEVSGFICKEHDVDAVVQRIKLMNYDIDLRHIMGKQAVKFVNSEYSQDVLDNRWDVVYNKMISK